MPGFFAKILNLFANSRKLNRIAKKLSQLIEHTKKQIEILKLHLSAEKQNFYYKINFSGNSSKNSAVSIISDAILQELQVVQIVARSTDNFLEMGKILELMSELDKDELIHKKIFHEL